MTDPQQFLINFKETADVKDIILVLNSLSMVTHNADLIGKLKSSDNIILKEIERKKDG